jgi:hypothetical protein
MYNILLRLGRVSCFITLSLYLYKQCSLKEYISYMIIIVLIAFFSELIGRNSFKKFEINQ